MRSLRLFITCRTGLGLHSAAGAYGRSLRRGALPTLRCGYPLHTAACYACGGPSPVFAGMSLNEPLPNLSDTAAAHCGYLMSVDLADVGGASPTTFCCGQVAFTALGRMEAMARRPEGALEAAKRTLAAGHPAKLRIFTPALRAFCAAGNHAKAFEVGRQIAHTTC